MQNLTSFARDATQTDVALQYLRAQANILPAQFKTKHEFLRMLAGKSSARYKRYAGLPLRYAGGKSLAVGYVVEHIPSGVDKIVSPFFGGGSVEIACANELGIEVAGYDVFAVLVNYWRVQLASPNKLAKRIARWRPTDDDYAKVKSRLKRHWQNEKPITDKTDLAAHYWFNHNLSYGPGFLGWMSKIYREPDRFLRLLDKVKNFRCAKLTVAAGSFTDTIKRHRNDFLYCDPPYYLDGDSKMFRGIYPQRNFPIHHNGFDHRLLRDMLRAHNAGFVLSYNDCETIRKWYADCKIVEVKWQYTLGQGETRIGKNRIENGSKHHVKKSHELLIVREY